jgi:hypothetical protein
MMLGPRALVRLLVPAGVVWLVLMLPLSEPEPLFGFVTMAIGIGMARVGLLTIRDVDGFGGYWARRLPGGAALDPINERALVNWLGVGSAVLGGGWIVFGVLLASGIATHDIQ